MVNEEIDTDDTTIPPGAIYGPVAILDGIPEGWKVCDGTNGTPRLDSSSIANLAAIKKMKDKEFAYVMKE
jgi:hypothetical protein